MKGPSLRLRITAWYVGLLAAALVAFGSFLYWSLGHSLFNSLNRQLASNADNIAQEFVARAPQKGDVFLVHEINETYAPRSSGWFIRILGPTKTVLYQSGQPRNAEWKPEDVPFPSYDLTHGEYSKAEVDGSRLASFALPYRGYIIQVARSEAQEQENLRSLLLALLLLTPLTLVAAVLGGYGLMSLPLAPVASLMEQAEHVGIGNMGRRLSVIRTGDELERLSLSLNRMIARLEDSLSHNQRFCADVSHELRTPLTIMRSEMEHVIQLPSLESGISEAIGSVMEEIERMARIIDNLLCISGYDSGTCEIQFQSVELAEFATSLVDQMSLLAEEKDISVVCQGGPEVTVKTDPIRLRQILVNLLDNAIKYTPGKGTVTLAWQRAQDHALLTVEDTGQGISPEELPFVFDRFYRTDHARSRESGGTGLGLSIVKAIAAAISAKVSLASYPQKGTRVSVEIPLWEDDPLAPSVHPSADRDAVVTT